MTHILTELNEVGQKTFLTCFNEKELFSLLKNTVNEIFSYLIEEMKNEKHLLHPNKEALEKSFADGLGCIVLKKTTKDTFSLSSIVGFCRLIPLVNDEGNVWYEFGTVFINKNVRNKGVSTAMYKDFLSCHNDKLILATTTNPAAISVGKKVGFIIVPRKSLPEVVWRASCTCDTAKMCASSASSCQLANTEVPHKELCYFRITQETSAKITLKKTLDF